jgi:hypothetical protein
MILSTTCGHPGWWNDKRLVLFDDFVCGLKYGTVLSDVEFQSFERDLSGKTILVKYRGSWFIVDNRYLDWSVTVPPMKDPETYPELRWSKWVESMRKDVECVFGILKGRFRILKTGI